MTVIMSAALSRGSTIVSLPRFGIDDFLGAIEQHKVSIAYVVPPIVLALTKHPAVDNYDISSLKFLNSGGAPLGEDLEKACAERIGCVDQAGLRHDRDQLSDPHEPLSGQNQGCHVRPHHSQHRVPDRRHRDRHETWGATRGASSGSGGHRS